MKEESKRLEVIKFFVIHSDEKNLSLLLFGKNDHYEQRINFYFLLYE